MQCASAVYLHVWTVWLYRIIPHYLINGTIYEKKVTEHKLCALIFAKICLQ